MSVLKHAVLGSVLERPDHGYRLTLRLKATLGWENLTRQAVYLQLDRLTGDGLVRKSANDSSTDGGSRRTLYEATSAGAKSFEAWMCAPCPLEQARDELYAKIALSQRRNLPELIALTWQLERDCLARVRELERASGASSSLGRVDRWAGAAEVLLRNREVAALQTDVRWLQRARAVMEKLREEGDGDGVGVPRGRG